MFNNLFGKPLPINEIGAGYFPYGTTFRYSSAGSALDDHLLDAPGSRIGTEDPVDFLLGRLRPGGLSHMPGAPVLAPEGGGHPLLALEDAAESLPAVGPALTSELPADGLHQLVGDHGEEPVPVGTFLGVVEDGSQAQFGLEGAEHGLHVGEGDVGVPEGFLVPVPDIGAQAVNAGVGVQGSVPGLSFPGHRPGPDPGVVGNRVDDVVGAGTTALLPDAADALPDMVEPLAGTGPRKALVQFLQFSFEAHAEALDDAPFLLRPGLGVAVEPGLVALVVDLLHVDRLARAGLQGDRQVRVEAAGALPADHQIAVALVPQPGDVVLGGHPRCQKA